MSFLFFIFLICIYVFFRGVQTCSPQEQPLLPTNQHQYSGYTEPRHYHPPAEPRGIIPDSIPSSTQHRESLAPPRAQPQHSPRRPPLPLPHAKSRHSLRRPPPPPPPPPPFPSLSPPLLRPAVWKSQPYSFVRDDLPGALVEQVHRPATKAPIQKIVEPSVKPLEPVYPSALEIFLAARKPQQYSFSRNDLPGPSIEHVQRITATKPLVEPCIKPLGPVCQPAPELLGRKPLQPFQSSGSQDEAVIKNRDDDDNNLEKKDLDHLALRKLANQEWENMKKCRKEERLARRYGGLMRAREFANKAQRHGQRMQALNERASEVVFAKNNKDPALRKIDLHGLTVKEAIGHTTCALKQARERGNTEMRIIVGKGNHSKDGNPKLKPAIQTFLEKHQFPVEVELKNIGVLVVKIDSPLSF